MKMQRNIFSVATVISAAAAVSITLAAGSAASMTKAEFETEITEIISKYQPDLKEIEKQSSELGQDMPSNTEIFLNIGEMETISFSMDIPEFSMYRWEFGMHVPEVHMNHRKFSWDIPKCDWEMMDFGLFKTKFLKCSKGRHEWTTKIPEVSMKYRDMSMDIPEVTMKTRKFSFDFPKISAGGPQNRISEAERKGEVLKYSAEALSEAMQSEITDVTRSYLETTKGEAIKNFDYALATIEAGIKAAPTAEIKAELISKREHLITQRKTVLAEIDSQLNNVS